MYSSSATARDLDRNGSALSAPSTIGGSPPRLWGRSRECGALDGLIEGLRAGTSAALVLRGDAGVGKTSLLEYLVDRASDCRVARAAGVESETELPYAGLHQLCAPMLDRLKGLPAPQRAALHRAFGLEAGDAPDRFLVGLAVMNLLSDVAEERPVICVVDSVQWLDEASAQVLAFVGRRLADEPVALIFAVRGSSEDDALTGMPELVVHGLADADARALVESVIAGPIDARVRDRIVAETRGNPLALVELLRGVTSAELAGGFGLPDTLALSGRIEQTFRRELGPLPTQTRLLLLLAAAEPTGDPLLVWRAADALGIDFDAAAPAVAPGLIEFGSQVRFRHPLMRSAIYRAAAPEQLRSVHRALADSTDADFDPDRRAWHRAQAAPALDEDAAAELERSAARVQAHGGVPAAAAFLETATRLTPSPVRRAQRALAAAEAKLRAGDFSRALALLTAAEAGPVDNLRRARIDMLRARIELAARRGSDASPLLLAAARRLEPLDASLARETYLDAFSAAMFAGRSANGHGLAEVARAARDAPPGSGLSRNVDMLLDGLAVRFSDGYVAATSICRHTLKEFCRQDASEQDGLRWLWLASITAADLWDDEALYVLSTRHLEIARGTGALSEAPLALTCRTFMHLFTGELVAAASLVEHVNAVNEATGSELAPFGALALAAVRGGRDARALLEASMREMACGEGIGVTVMQWASALLCNGLGGFRDALVAARWAGGHPHEPAVAQWGLTELIEAAARSGSPELAADAIGQLSTMTRASGTDWALGVEARSRALLGDGETAEHLYREAIERLSHTRVRFELARAHLVYGEWLRRAGRRRDARTQLRTAHELLTAMGAEAFAERARRELVATGETVRARGFEARDELTAQELQVARLASDGRTNAAIGAHLFISPRTVEWHLRNVYAKLDIQSRRELAIALASLDSHLALA
jgi:DNA-binding CsgD family transcriptional regulator